jgi:Xaa-Pro aminopeptidase
MNEIEQKREKMHELLEQYELDALLLHRVSSFAWATCGAASYVNTATATGEAMLLITNSDHHLITNNIEATRLELEEKLAEQGWIIHRAPWYERNGIIEKLVGKGHLGADVPFPQSIDLSKTIAQYRANLSTYEVERFRTLASLCAQAMHGAIQSVKPGQTEHEIASRMAQHTRSHGVQAIVNLVATDERIFRFRHPLPTDKKLDRYAMLVLCGRRWGLVCSITRFIHFGSLSDDLRRKAEAVAKVDACLIDATCPGKKLSEIFQEAIHVYGETGFPDEWKLHHQGGPAGYEPREIVVTPMTEDRVSENQVYAWNPSVTGTKSEDSVLIRSSGNEVLTMIDGWPVLSVEINGSIYDRPAIFVV